MEQFNFTEEEQKEFDECEIKTTLYKVGEWWIKEDLKDFNKNNPDWVKDLLFKM